MPMNPDAPSEMIDVIFSFSFFFRESLDRLDLLKQSSKVDDFSTKSYKRVEDTSQKNVLNFLRTSES